ncbi:UDP-2,4-diacetamido-2,4,6-trideoxy-beta-L-altropyranose hydrolase [Brevibacillus sp. H7]|uniref:UDP-2,4-diacetamido-2,4, 6-trideoxy-beta-L-altropyranose hydrolase n=1 Tax=Brevibacillus sp. H7 TaxID=3349138 RepID=UPI00380CE426
MHVLFRVDASVQIGSGHVMRCLTLADELRRKGASIRIISREHPGHLCEFIEQKGFLVNRLPDMPERSSDEWWEIDVDQTNDQLRNQKVDWLIVDHYGIDYRWEKKARRFAANIMVIDDLADRAHDCDILLDQNLYEKMETRYDGLVPHQCLQLIGPRYAMLREEFREARKLVRKRGGRVRRVLLFFGGSDPTNETIKAIEAIKILRLKDVMVDVVVGTSNPYRGQIAELCANMPNTRFHCQITYMAELMLQADLAIGAGGSTTWERCALGLPAITVTTAENQIQVTRTVAKTGCIIDVGTHQDVSSEKLASVLQTLQQNPEMIASMSEACIRVMGDIESEGVTSVAQAILKGVNY